jgi:hypothetical protein
MAGAVGGQGWAGGCFEGGGQGRGGERAIGKWQYWTWENLSLYYFVWPTRIYYYLLKLGCIREPTLFTVWTQSAHRKFNFAARSFVAHSPPSAAINSMNGLMEVMNWEYV